MNSTMAKKQSFSVSVLGGGVIGLTCGVRLLQQGYPVTIITRDLPSQTTSSAAAAIWYIYAVRPLERARHWAGASLEEYRQLQTIPESGVSSLLIRELYKSPPGKFWWQGLLDGVVTPPAAELPEGYVHAYEYEVPLIETPIYLPYLVRCFEQRGGQMVRREIHSLSELYGENRVVVNSSGVWARYLAPDPQVYPIQGQTVRVNAPEIQTGLMDEHHPSEPVYVFPRSDGCVLGGTAYVENWNLYPDGETRDQIIARCVRFIPSLRDAEILGTTVGLRPGRYEVRLEFERISRTCAVIHNYGHGGAGFTLSWGCAHEVAALVDQFEATQDG
jgi:D-amino-acid oxidase